MRNSSKPVHGGQTGLSLIELMISMTLGLILMAGLVQIFVANKQSFVLSQALANVQESGREGAMILAREVRNADYWGCITEATSVQNNLNPGGTDDVLDFTRGLEIYADSDSTNAIVDGSHVIVLRGIGGGPEVTVDKVPAADSASLHVSDASMFDVGDILLVSDCENANIFQVSKANENGNDLVVHNTGGTMTPGNAIKTMPKKYSDNAKVYRPSVTRYSVQADASGRRSLVVERALVESNSGDASSLGAAVELVAEVRDMRTLIGVDTDGDGAVNEWRDPPAATDAGAEDVLATTLAVRVSLLVRSRDESVSDDPVAVCFPGWLDCTSAATGLQTPADSALYRAYTFTSSIRNRIIGEG